MTYDTEKMFHLAREVREKAHAPYSKFKVGVCIFADDGQYYTGCNIENTSYPQGQCAEPTAMGNMIVGGGRKILAALVISDTPQGVFPCGGCLQKLSEFVTETTEILVANLAGIQTRKPFSALFYKQFADVFTGLQKG